LIDDPDEAVGLFCPDVGFSWNPANVSAKVRNVVLLFRFWNVGLSRICSELSDCWTCWLVVLIRGGSAVTVVSCVIAGSNRKSTTVVELSVTLASRTTAPNPLIDAVIL
jgi:hypothetical protein